MQTPREKLIAEYSERYGGFPYYETAAMPDEELLPMIRAALDSDKELEFDEDRVY